MGYVAGKKNNDDFVKQVDDEVKKIRENKAWRRDYMTLLMRDREKFEEGRVEGRAEGRTEGRAEGRTEGREEGKLEIVTQLIHDGVFSVKEGAERLHMTETELEKHL